MPILRDYVTATTIATVVLAVCILAVAVVRTMKVRLQPTKNAKEEPLSWAWWVEVGTVQPRCTYYFGPFISKQDAELVQPGYIEDLEAEGAQGITVQIKQCQPPKALTTCEDELEESFNSGIVQAFRSQLS